MRTVVAAVIVRSERRLVIGQRRRNDSSPLKWECPGGKVEAGETPERALARELKEELGVSLRKWVPIGRVVHKYAETPEELEILFFAAVVSEDQLIPRTFEKLAWRSEEHTSELQSQFHLVCRLLLEKKKKEKKD